MDERCLILRDQIKAEGSQGAYFFEQLAQEGDRQKGPATTA